VGDSRQEVSPIRRGLKAASPNGGKRGLGIGLHLFSNLDWNESEHFGRDHYHFNNSCNTALLSATTQIPRTDSRNQPSWVSPTLFPTADSFVRSSCAMARIDHPPLTVCSLEQLAQNSLIHHWVSQIAPQYLS